MLSDYWMQQERLKDSYWKKAKATFDKALVKYLTKLVNATTTQEKWRQLLVGADDTEMATSYTAYDKAYVVEKACAIIAAVSHRYTETYKGNPCTWQESCKVVGNKPGRNVHSKTVESWYAELHHNFTGFDSTSLYDLRFKWSERGRTEWAAASPFKTDRCMMLQFKLWAKSDIAHLTVSKATTWVNDFLLQNWQVKELRLLGIKGQTVKEHTVRHWMRDAGFVYEAYKKCYYVGRHKAEDVVANRDVYIPCCFDEEILEHVWVQMPLETYN
jgi:hypothetical protein